DSTYARASLADRFITRVFGRNLRLPAPPGSQSTALSTEGSTRNWEVKWQVSGEAAPAEALKLINDRLVASQWAKQNTPNHQATRSLWKFSDEDGGAWSGVAEAEPAGDKIMTVSLKVERTGADSAKPTASSVAPAEKLIVRDAWIQEMPPSRRFTAAHM